MAYRAAIVGMGNIGYQFQDFHVPFPTTHFEVYQHHADIELVAVCDTDAGKVRAIEQTTGVKGYTNLVEMLETEQPEVVSICTPDGTHLSVLETVLTQKSVGAIWCEKPLALSTADARTMIEACEARGVTLVVNFVRRYDPFYHAVKEQYKKLLGDIQVVTCYVSGGVVTAGSHMIDLLQFLFGDCTTVSAEKTSNGIVGRLTVPGVGPIQYVSMQSAAYPIFELDIVGTEGRLDIMNKPFGEYVYRYTVKEKSTLVPAHMLLSTEERPFKPDMPRTYMENALHDLLTAMKEKIEPVSSGVSAYQSLAVLAALWYSANQNGMIVSLPLPTDVSFDLPVPAGDAKLWQKL